LRYDSPRLIALRTVAPDNVHIWNEPRFRDTDARTITHWGIEPAEVGPIVAPGEYRVSLTVDGRTVTRPLTVLPDPNSPGSNDDIRQSVQTLRRICADITHVSDAVNQIEWLRRQLEVVRAMFRPAMPADKDRPAAAGDDDDDDEPQPAPAPARVFDAAQTRQRHELLAAAEKLDGDLQSVEQRYVARALQDSDDKYFVEQDRLYLNLLWLNAEVGTGGGDVAGSADFAPSATQLDLLAELESEMAAPDAALDTALKRDLPAFNRQLEANALAPLVN
jgi:hypothetical protein